MVTIFLRLLKIKKLLLFTYLCLHHQVINADSIDFGINQINGTSSYEVEAKSMGLRSELFFPYNLNSFNISFLNELSSGKIKIAASVPISYQNEVATDYDWKLDELTVFSTSFSHLDKFFNFHAQWEKELFSRIGFITKIYYQELDTVWNNTRQHDYVRDIKTLSNKNTLEFEQNYLMYDTGFSYLAWKSKSITFSIEAKYTFGLVKLKDNHILRDFYTIQDSKVDGHSFGLKLGYDLGSLGKIFFEVTKKNIKDEQTMMDYFTTDGFKFASYPSNYHDISKTYGITFEKYIVHF